MQNSSEVRDYKKHPKYQWYIEHERKCFEENITHSTIVNKKYDEDGLWCPRTFDGFLCWDDTPAANKAYQRCPHFVTGFDPRRLSYKTCMEDGTWYANPETNMSWTNYTTCVDMEDLNFRNIVNNVYVLGYSLSTVALLISIAILLFFRTLQCTRTRVHVHLFTSLVINNTLWIVWYRVVVISVEIIQENSIWCQVFHVVIQYFMVTGYLWMFCEGLHLHLALVVVFVKDDVAMRWFLALGWGLPVIIVGTYAAVRYYSQETTDRCWMDQGDAFWIIAIPVGISILASFVFLVNVVRVLLTKLHPAANQHRTEAAKKAVRAALILVPLFGVHFILLPYRPLPESPWEKTYQIVSALLTSFQGLCVAILFCFTNHDVKIATKNYFSRLRNRNEGIPMTGLTGGESLI